MVNHAHTVQRRRNSVGGSESGGEASEADPDVSRRSEGGVEEEPAPRRESAVSVSRLTRRDMLGREGFRGLFYEHGLAPVEVMEVLDLSAEGVGALMRRHGVGAFEHVEVSDERVMVLMSELSDEEWASVVQ